MQNENEDVFITPLDWLEYYREEKRADRYKIQLEQEQHRELQNNNVDTSYGTKRNEDE